MKEYKGISWHSQTQRWRASVGANGIKYDCGKYVNQIDAVKARDRKIINLGLKVDLQIFKKL